MAFHSSSFTRLLQTEQLKHTLGIVTLLVLTLVDPSVQPLPADRRQACSKPNWNVAPNGIDCQCSVLTVECTARTPRLTYVPAAIPATITTLGLENNTIERIEDGDFLGLEKLQTLFLQQNKINYIHPQAFRNLYKLKSLHLQGNMLGHLDPSGRIFQHLSSLSSLLLQNSGITKINKYSFLTTIISNPTVALTENVIQCDCDFWALRSWANSLTSQPFQPLNMGCVKAKGGLVQEIENSEFKDCSGSGEIFSQNIKCPVCKNQRTNAGCRSLQLKTCLTTKMMCKKTITWTEATRVMSINSACTNYEACLKEEAKNNATCGIGYQTNGDVKCDLCCRNSTCGEKYVEGRTKDFTFSYTYVKTNAEDDFYYPREDTRFTQEEARIDAGIRGSVDQLKGGMDVHVTQFRKTGVGKKLTVVLRLEVTTFNTETKETVKKIISESLNLSLGKPDSFLYKEGIESHILRHMDEVIKQCPMNVSTNADKGDIQWDESPSGETHKKPCPYMEQNYSLRTCVQKSDNSVAWGDADYSSCPSKKKLENLTPNPENVTADELFNVQLSLENAHSVSNLLRNYTENLDNVTLDSLNDTVQLLEQFTNETILKVPGVVTNVVVCLSNLMDVDEKTFMELEMQTPVSERLLDIVDFISEKAPLIGGQLVQATRNLVIVAQEINTTKAQDVALITDSDSSRKFSANLVNVNILNESISQRSGKSSMVIPLLAIVDSLTSVGKFSTLAKIRRVSCAVHQTDKLFFTAKHRSDEVSQANRAQNDDCGKNKNFECKKQNLTTKINSNVIAARIPGVEVQNLTKNITMRFIHTDVNSKNPRCVFWDKSLSDGRGDWSDEGCIYVESNSSETICACNHLTNFALLMDVYQGGAGISERDKKTLSIISYVGCGISLLALILTLLTYTVFRSWRQHSGNSDAKNSGTNTPKVHMSERRYSDPKKTRKLRRDNPSKILINLCLALLLSNLIFVVGMQKYTSNNTFSCKVVAVLMHYFLLASLTWMAVEAFYMYLALILVFKTYFTHFVLKCSLVGWGVPLVIVTVTLCINSTENYGFLDSGLCWLRNPAFFGAFVGPVCLILLINCIAFGLVIRTLIGVSSPNVSKTDRNNTFQRLRGAVGVVVLLGLTWLFAIFAIGQANLVFYYFFAILNSLQGFFIFIFYCLLKKDAVLSWKRTLPCFDKYGETSKSSSNSKAIAAVPVLEAVTAKGGSHHLVKKHDSRSKSDSSTFLANTTSVSSTLIDSSKNSGLNNVNTKHPYDSSEECDTIIHSETLDSVEDYKQRLSPLLSQHEDQDSQGSDTEKPPSFTMLEYGTSSNDFNSSAERTHKGSTSIDNKSLTVLFKGSSLATVPDESEANKLTLQSHKEKDGPISHTSNTNGEVDMANQAKVSDIILKFEHPDSDKTDLCVTHL